MKISTLILSIFLTSCASLNTRPSTQRAIHTGSLYGIGLGFSSTLVSTAKKQNSMLPISIALTGVMLATGIMTNPRPEYVFIPYPMMADKQ